jgi:hypothetical protein
LSRSRTWRGGQLLLIDYQPLQLAGVCSTDRALLVKNAVATVETGKTLRSAGSCTRPSMSPPPGQPRPHSRVFLEGCRSGSGIVRVGIGNGLSRVSSHGTEVPFAGGRHQSCDQIGMPPTDASDPAKTPGSTSGRVWGERPPAPGDGRRRSPSVTAAKDQPLTAPTQARGCFASGGGVGFKPT